MGIVNPAADAKGMGGGFGPVVPRRVSTLALRPATRGNQRLTSGFWFRRQQLNREVTIPLGIELLGTSGAIENLARTARREQGSFRPPVFRDSDVYKVLEAVAWDRQHGLVPAHEDFFNATSELLSVAQADDGYLNSWVQLSNPDRRFADFAMGHELYCAGHLFQAAVADERSTGKGDLLRVALRLADYLVGTLLGDRSEVTPGHPEIETALIELYRLSGSEQFLTLARSLLDRRGYGRLGPGPFGPAYFQDDIPVERSRTVRGHAVRALYLAAGATDCYIETGRGALLEAMLAQWEDAASHKTYITGGLGSRHLDEAFGDPYELPADRAYCETCASIANIMWGWRMLLITGEARFADSIERTLYNAFAASLSADGTRFFYVNPLRSRGLHHREEWYECACCPPNVMRLLASLEHYVATTSDEGIELHQFMSSELTMELSSGEVVGITVETDYPWDGTVTVRLDRVPDQEMSLSLRQPGWAVGVTARLNGQMVDGEVQSRGYWTIRRRWRPGDEVSVHFPLRTRVVEPHPAVDAVRSSLAIERGPLVYCFEGIGVPGSKSVDGIGLPAPLVVRDAGTRIVGGERVAALSVTAVEPGLQDWGSWPYRDAYGEPRLDEPGTGRRTDVEAIPYYAWDNREPSDMRVWVPRSDAQ